MLGKRAIKREIVKVINNLRFPITTRIEINLKDYYSNKVLVLEQVGDIYSGDIRAVVRSMTVSEFESFKCHTHNTYWVIDKNRGGIAKTPTLLQPTLIKRTERRFY
jgi:hypothetical protein